MVSSAFANIVGQSQAIALLTRAITCNRIAPAYLFVGPHGVGRRQVARRFLDQLISIAAAPTQPRRLQQDNHPDILWVEPTYRSQGKLVTLSDMEARGRTLPRSRPQIRLAQIRQITRFLSQSPLEATRLLVVIDHAETLGEAAANGLLKTLEEPGNATLILLAPTAEALLPTLVSRCQRIPFYRLTGNQMQQVLEQAGYAEILEQPQILSMAQGSPGAAIASWQQQQSIPAELLQACQTRPHSPRTCLELAQQIDKALDLQEQLWLIDYLQQDYWHTYGQSQLLQILEKARRCLQSYAQARLVWEVTLLDLQEVEPIQPNAN